MQDSPTNVQREGLKGNAQPVPKAEVGEVDTQEDRGGVQTPRCCMSERPVGRPLSSLPAVCRPIAILEAGRNLVASSRREGRTL